MIISFFIVIIYTMSLILVDVSTLYIEKGGISFPLLVPCKNFLVTHL